MCNHFSRWAEQEHCGGQWVWEGHPAANQELQEANEQANLGKHKCIELQGKKWDFKAALLVVCIFETWRVEFTVVNPSLSNYSG